jgi:large subunit ribosomal protein L6e
MSTTKTFGSGSREVPSNKASKWYPTSDEKQPKKARKTQHPTKLRASLTPGTILIILAGRFRGKRVVYLKPLDNGVLLVTGPFSLNGVPLRRVNARYVIATSTKIDLGSLDLEKYDEKYFAREKETKKSGEDEFFDPAKAKEKKPIPENRSTDQKEVDKSLRDIIKQTPQLTSYLKSTFSLSKGDRPHLMKW